MIGSLGELVSATVLRTVSRLRAQQAAVFDQIHLYLTYHTTRVAIAAIAAAGAIEECCVSLVGAYSTGFIACHASDTARCCVPPTLLFVEHFFLYVGGTGFGLLLCWWYCSFSFFPLTFLF